MTTTANIQIAATAPVNGKSIKSVIRRLKAAGARFWETYQEGLESGHFWFPMP